MNVNRMVGGIEDRQDELHSIAELLGKAGSRYGRSSAFSRAITITLGAFVATNAVAMKLWGDGNATIIIIYTLTGLVIAAVSGLEAAFKVESRAAALRTLAAYCHTTIWQIDTEARKTVGFDYERKYSSEEETNIITAAEALLDRQDQVIGEVQSKAAELGVDIIFEVR